MGWGFCFHDENARPGTKSRAPLFFFLFSAAPTHTCMAQRKRKNHQIADDDDGNNPDGEDQLINIKKVIDVSQAGILKLSKQVELLKHGQEEINSKLQKLLDRPAPGVAGESTSKPHKLLSDVEEVCLPLS